jgi:hypothetical protein
VGWQKKRVDHEVFLPKKGGHLKMFRWGSSYFIIVEGGGHVTITATAGSEQGSKFNSCS